MTATNDVGARRQPAPLDCRVRRGRQVYASDVAISFSRPDPSSPAGVADAVFGTARRGFDQQEVRDFLRMVGAELARLQERERFLERELRTVQADPLASSGGGPLDDETATRLLGEEAARILQTAREGGASIRGRAEDGAAQLLREASDEARRVREEADLEAARRRTDAAADAEAELSMAKQQGREMVEEARAYRERVLGELARRRDLARQQIEQLVHGRDRLVQAFERARLVAVDVTAELSPLGEPIEYVDLTPTTGPVPIMIPAGRIGEASSIDDLVPPAPAPAADEAPDEAVEASPDGPVDELANEPEIDDTVVAFPTPDATPYSGPEPDERHQLEHDPDEIDDDDVSATDVDALFARLRANPPDEPEPDPAVSDADEEDTPFRARDAAIVPLIVAAARKLKRVLADEQNDVLDALRRKEPVTDVGTLLAAPDEQATRYGDAVGGELLDAVRAGAASVAGELGTDDRPLVVTRDEVTDALVTPLRERLERAVVDGDGSNEAVTKRVRAVYREWKTQRIDEHLDAIMRLAYGQGAIVALASGTPVTWAVDPDGPPSPDCEDNELAGAVPAGEAFPSGHLAPPMHPGCRCLLVQTDR